jgi:hypothetical protein
MIHFVHLCASHTATLPFFKKHSCFTTCFFAAAKKSRQKMPLAAKVFNSTKRLVLRSFQMSPSNFHSNGNPRGVRLPFAPKISLFELKL